MSNITKRTKYKVFLESWLEIQLKYIKRSTYSSYTNMVYNHVIPSLGEYPIGKINSNVLQKVIDHKLSDGRIDGNGGLALKTIRDMLMLIKTSLRSAINDGYISNTYYNVKLPKDNKSKKLNVIPQNEYYKLIEYLITSTASKDKGIILSLFTGIRIGELCALKYSDINFKKNTVSISKTLQRTYTKENSNTGYTELIITTPKSNSSIREIPVNSAIIKQLNKTVNSNFILSDKNTPIEPRALRQYFTKLLKNLKLPHYTFHSLRHTFATKLIEKKADYKTVSDLLGHSNISTTINLYVHTQMKQKRKTINLLKTVIPK